MAKGKGLSLGPSFETFGPYGTKLLRTRAATGLAIYICA